MSIFEWAVIAFIIASIGFVVWRGGAANPESTGALSGKFTGMSDKLTTISGRVGQVERRLGELERDSATVKDIARIEERIATVRAEIETLRVEMNGHKELSAGTNRNVQRIYDVLMERGLGK